MGKLKTRRKSLRKRYRKKKSRKSRKHQKGGNGESIITEYLNDLYSNALPDFTNCYFNCNLQKDDPPFGPAINEKYRRAEVGVPTLSCNEKPIGRPALNESKNAITQIPDADFPKDYFRTINAENEGNDYFKKSYKTYFGEEYSPGNQEWTNLKNIIKEKKINSVDATDNTIIILGPAELLSPFSNDQAFFHVLSHADWTPNVNFNYIIDILCKKGEFFFVLPTGETNRAIENKANNRYTLAAPECNEFVRATLSELLITRDLELAGLITVDKIPETFSIPNINLSSNSYDITVLHVKTKETEESALCKDTIIVNKPIDYSK